MSLSLAIQTGSTFISHIRRNHALEHASIHVLSTRYPLHQIVGYSDSQGFFLYSSLPIESIEQAVSNALSRLRAGERRLAIHPNCGTNLLAAAALTATASFLALNGLKEERWQERLERLPVAIMASVIGLMAARPLGNAIQKHITTQSDLYDLEVISIEPIQRGKYILYRIKTRI